MSDEAPLIKLIVNADPGMNYQWKAAAQAQGAHTALPGTPCSLVFPNYGKGGREGPRAKGCPNGILRSSCNITSHLLEPPSMSRTCPGGSLDAKKKNPFRWCVKVLLEMIEVCERGRGCCCPKRPPATPNPPHCPSQVRR